jgi:hypothetical protein
LLSDDERERGEREISHCTSRTAVTTTSRRPLRSADSSTM